MLPRHIHSGDEENRASSNMNQILKPVDIILPPLNSAHYAMAHYV